MKHLPYFHLLPTYICYRENHNLFLHVINSVSWYIKCLLQENCQNWVKHANFFSRLYLRFVWHILSQFHDIKFKVLLLRTVNMFNHINIHYLFQIQLIGISKFRYGTEFLVTFFMLHINCIGLNLCTLRRRNKKYVTCSSGSICHIAYFFKWNVYNNI
jgi:hypothetical protein